MFEERIKKLPAYALGFNTLLIGNAGCGDGGSGDGGSPASSLATALMS